MPTTRYDVLGIGNAIVDVIANTEDDFLVAHGMRKGGMTLIDEARARTIYDAMGPAIRASGGSAANTIVGVASLGARAAFVGKVNEDQLGRVFIHDIRAAGVAFHTEPARSGPSTARCYIMVTPDGERTMNTFLGAAQDLKALRHRRDGDFVRRRHLSRRLSVGSAAGQGSLRQGGGDRAQGRAAGGADAVGRVLRRPLPRRISRSHQEGHRRYRLRQREGTAQPLSDGGFRHRGESVAQRRQARAW